MREWCKEYNILFKLNTVVNKFNYLEDMTENVKKLNPVRWKVFQCLPIEVIKINALIFYDIHSGSIFDGFHETSHDFLSYSSGITDF